MLSDVRRPRPSCWRKTVALSVGRRSSNVSTSGRSMGADGDAE
jgi:hypothetical protein